MKALENNERLRYIPPYSRRKDFCRKIRETEKQIQQLKSNGHYYRAKHLGWLLRNAWWGYTRYEFK